MDLRPYQTEAVNALWAHIAKSETNPCLVLPTGAGKTHLLAKLALDIVGWNGRAIFVSHVKELIEQAAGHLEKYAPSVSFGVYSAGIGSRDIGYQVTLAGIQSVYEKSALFGSVDLVVIDEAHRVPADGEGMYRTFLAGLATINPRVRLIGLTATPYRTSSGPLCGPNNLLHEIVFEVRIKELIRDGFLCPLRSKAGKEKPDLSGVHVRAGEFVQEELEEAMNTGDKVARACWEIAEKTQDRKSVLVFGCGIEHAKSIASMLSEFGETRTIFGDTDYDERSDTVKAFRTGTVKYLVNVSVLTTGFDAPATDCVAILRPTMSPGLFYQMCGRGFRIADGKKDCLILDFGGNVARHGPVDAITPPARGKEQKSKATRECPQCQEVIPYSCEVCPDCGFEFIKEEREKREAKHEGQSSDDEILSDNSPKDFPVLFVKFWKHRKKNSPLEAPSTLQVRYECNDMIQFSEWVCFEHTGFARTKAAQWWRARASTSCPATVDEAITRWHELKIPTRIRVKPEGKYTRIVWAGDFVDQPKPEPDVLEEKKANGYLTEPEEEIPF